MCHVHLFVTRKKAENDLVQEVYTYLTAKRYPDGVSEGKKRVIRKIATKFLISDNGVMFYKHKKKQKVTYVSYIPIRLAGIEPSRFSISC